MRKSFKNKIGKLIAEFEQLHVDFENEIDVMREKYDNRSEKWQDSDAGEAFNEQIGQIEECAMSIDDLLDNLRTAFEEGN